MDFETLYGRARGLPIIDWHNHLDMRMLAEDKPLGSLYEVWVKADPYKHRAMRICGEPERLITGTGTTGVSPVGDGATGTTGVSPVGGGDSDEAEKWSAWMRTLPKLVGNPLFAWAKMELEWLGLDANAYLRGEGANIMLSDWTPSKLLARFNVEYLSPCLAPNQLELLGQRASRPLHSQSMDIPSNGRDARCPSDGQDARCPSSLAWTAAKVREFSDVQSGIVDHFSHMLNVGDSHRRNLPHIGQSSTLVFVTFRLADSLPQSQLDELEAFRAEWLREHPEPWDETTRQEWASARFERIEKWLDAGHGACMLADPCLRKVVEDALEFFNRDATGSVSGVADKGQDAILGQRASRPLHSQSMDIPSNGRDARCPSGAECNGQDARCPSDSRRSARYRLHGYIVMPNHVHVLMELFRGDDLAKVVQSWKSFTAKEINRIIGSSGKVWMAEYYDRLIRNVEHYDNTLRYIRKNGEVARRLAVNKGQGAPLGQRASCPLDGMSKDGECNGQDARCPSGVECNGQDARCPSGVERNGQDARCPSGAERKGQDARCPSGAERNGQDARCPSGVRVVPSLRMNAGDEVAEEALERFHDAGCRVVDISVDDVDNLQSSISNLQSVAAFAVAHGWTMLLHMGALRETSARLRAAAGPAGGFAGMRGPVDPAAVARFLDRLEGNGRDARCPSGLPRTILLTLNPEAHAQLAVLAGSFVEEGMPGKVQLGPAWWWCDHAEAIRDVFEKQAAYGVLSTFVGMTTDSRSLLSFVRHDYFRRLFCRWLADKVATGEFPDDPSLLLPIVENVCYRNARAMVGDGIAK